MNFNFRTSISTTDSRHGLNCSHCNCSICTLELTASNAIPRDRCAVAADELYHRVYHHAAQVLDSDKMKTELLLSSNYGIPRPTTADLILWFPEMNLLMETRRPTLVCVRDALMTGEWRLYMSMPTPTICQALSSTLCVPRRVRRSIFGSRAFFCRQTKSQMICTFQSLTLYV